MSITTIGLVLVQHFHRNKDTRSLTAGGAEQSDQPTPLYGPLTKVVAASRGYMRSSMVSPSSST